MARKKKKTAPKRDAEKTSEKGQPKKKASAPNKGSPPDEGIPPLYLGIALVGALGVGYILYVQYQSQPEAPAESGEAGDPLTAPADVAEPPEDAERTPSGLASKVLEEGSGPRHPTATSRVRVHYVGWTTDGERFDSSLERGEPAEFGLNGVIAGWTEGLQLMVEGERRRFWIPENLAYRGQPGRPAGMLVFDVQLIAILD